MGGDLDGALRCRRVLQRAICPFVLLKIFRKSLKDPQLMHGEKKKNDLSNKKTATVTRHYPMRVSRRGWTGVRTEGNFGEKFFI